MDKPQPPTKTFNAAPLQPSKSSSSDTAVRIDSIALLLNRLALHCPVRNLPEGQNDLLMQDTIADLIEYQPQQIAQACDAWRRGPHPFFPTSGQLIALIPKPSRSPWNKPAYRAPNLLEGPRPVLKPYRQILAEKRLSLPPTADEEPPKPAQQEVTDASGALSPERRAELRALREKMLQRVEGAA